MRLRLALADRNVDLGEGETVLGRDESCDVVLRDRSVSRRHAVVVARGASVTIRDLGSRNGSWVNGARTVGDRRLRAGDRVELGVCALSVTQVLADHDDHDDGWIAVQAALLAKASTAGRTREADEIVFRLAEAIEARVSIGGTLAGDVADAALSSIIDYAPVRERQGWIRWAIAVHAKLGHTPGPAVLRALEAGPDDTGLRTSGTVSSRLSIPAPKVRSA